MKSIRKVSGRLFLGLSMVLLNTGALSYAQTNTFPNDGNVGIGTVSPNVSGQPGTVLSISSGSANGFIELIGNRTTNANVGGIDFINNATSNTRIATILGSRVDQDNSGELQFYTNAAGAGLVQRMVISKSGSLGVGTTNPTYGLHVVSDDMLLQGNSNLARFRLQTETREWAVNNNGTLADIFQIYDVTANQTRFAISASGNVGIGTTTPSAKLHVAGDVTVDGNIAAKYQDVAEWVRADASLAPGTVVVIDPAKDDQVLPASRPYDTRVAGVVSSQPGIILGGGGRKQGQGGP